MRSMLLVFAGALSVGAVAYLLVVTRPAPHRSTHTAESEATVEETAQVKETRAAPRIAARTEAAAPSTLAMPAQALPILTGPPPFDPKPIDSVTEPRSFPSVKEVQPVREVGSAVAWRQSAELSPSSEARMEAVMKLAQFGGPSDVPALNRIIATDPDLRVREAAHHAVLVIHSRFSGQAWK